MRRCWYVLLLYMLLVLCVSCEKSFNLADYEKIEDDNKPTLRSDTLVYDDGEVQLWLSNVEITGLVLDEMEDIITLLPQGWRAPNIYEGRYLHTLALQGKHSSERYLCYDYENDVWYSFLFDNKGSVTKAGRKSKYTLCGVKTIDVNGNADENGLQIGVDDKWEEDLDVVE